MTLQSSSISSYYLSSAVIIFRVRFRRWLITRLSPYPTVVAAVEVQPLRSPGSGSLSGFSPFLDTRVSSGFGRQQHLKSLSDFGRTAIQLTTANG